MGILTPKVAFVLNISHDLKMSSIEMFSTNV